MLSTASTAVSGVKKELKSLPGSASATGAAPAGSSNVEVLELSEHA